MCFQQNLRSACAYAQSDQRLCLLLEYYVNIKLLTKHHLEFLSLKCDDTGSSESTLFKMSHCLKYHVAAHGCFTSLHLGTIDQFLIYRLLTPGLMFLPLFIGFCV